MAIEFQKPKVTVRFMHMTGRWVAYINDRFFCNDNNLTGLLIRIRDKDLITREEQEEIMEKYK